MPEAPFPGCIGIERQERAARGMRLLICGAKGQLGEELTSLIATGRGDIAPVDARWSDVELTRTDVVADPESRTLPLDITDAAAVDAFLADGAFDWVVNCAAATNVDGCESDPAFAERLNADAPANLARACRALGARLVQVSTDYVLPGDDPLPQTEAAIPCPKTVYGATKLEGERRVLELAPGSLVVRTAWLYGRTGRNFVRTMAGLGRTRGSVRVVSDQHGSPTNANDLGWQILELMAWADEVGEAASGIWHATNDGATTWDAFAREIFRLLGLECEVVPVTTEEWAAPAPRPAWSILDNKRLRDTIGDAMRSWDVALASFLREADL